MISLRSKQRRRRRRRKRREGREGEEGKKKGKKTEENAQLKLFYSSLILVSVQPRNKQKVVSPYQLNIRLDILNCITEPVVHGAKKLLSQAWFTFLPTPSLN